MLKAKQCDRIDLLALRVFEEKQWITGGTTAHFQWKRGGEPLIVTIFSATSRDHTHISVVGGI
jgi:hypothetical protein